jgi:threonine synthase
MMYLSTRHAAPSVNFQEALFQGLAPDGGLYVPDKLFTLPSEALAHFENDSLLDLGEKIIHHFLPEIPAEDLRQVIHQTLTFPIPLVPLENNLFLLEVFHGPTLAFKDVGARFMASMLSYFLAKHDQRVTILVATSGDTGSAIAHGFYNIPHVDVYILYPSQKITLLQEKQMTTLGGNIHAIEVTGTFDDCQKLVKTALSDEALKNELALTTANSINIARLLPQIIYHSWGLAQFKQHGFKETPVLSVPSGNFGNLTAAIYAKQIGFPLQHFIAATNVNAIVPHYLKTGEFVPQPSKQSCSNAMDVGNPSNFERLQELYSHNHAKMGQEVTGISISDESTLHEIRQTYEKTGYILDPHTAVGVAAARQFQSNDAPRIVTATAHPAKFPEVIKRAIQIDVELPENLAKALKQPKQSRVMAPDYSQFKKLLLNF